MRDLQAVINATQSDTAVAFNAVADVLDYLAVLDMALAFEDSAVAPFSQLTTVLGGARDLAKKAQDSLEKVSGALAKEVRL